MHDHRVRIDRSAEPSRLEFPERFNATAAFVDRHLTEGREHKVAIYYDEETVTFAQLSQRVDACATALKRLGLVAGERVVLVLHDCPAFFYTFWGCIKIGLIPVPVNTLLRSDDYRFIIDDSACAAVIYADRYQMELNLALAEAERLPRRRLCLEADSAAESLKLELLMAEALTAGAIEAADTKPDDECFWLYSSGSTGRPKAAVHRHKHLVVSSQRYAVETLGLREDDRCFSAAKLFFAYGLGNAMAFPLWLGASAILMAEKPTPRSSFAVIEAQRPSVYFGVPTLYAAQLRALDDGQKVDLGSLRICVSAGEALPPELFSRWRDYCGHPPLDGIGSTEALHIFISNRPNDAVPGRSGRAVPGYELRIVDDAGESVPDGQAGRLRVRGQSCATHYWNAPEKTTATMIDGWLDTGDTYIRDAEGRYQYCGRSDDMLKVGGIWCSPFEIEAKLVEHPEVLEAAVVGKADDAGLIKPRAVVVCNQPLHDEGSAERLREELVVLCQESLARYKYPRWIDFVEALPKTATGKIQRFKLR